MEVRLLRDNELSSIVKLQRWLDRLSEACQHKKWTTAIAEADCLSAELRLFRNDIYAKAENSIENVSTCKQQKAMFAIKTFGTAMLIICFCTIPISVESARPRNIAALPIVQNKEFTLVSAEEKELLQMLRANLMQNNTGLLVAEKPRAKKTISRKTMPHVANSVNAQYTIKTEDMLTLMQIGERSLRGTGNVIKVIN